MCSCCLCCCKRFTSLYSQRCIFCRLDNCKCTLSARLSCSELCFVVSVLLMSRRTNKVIDWLNVTMQLTDIVYTELSTQSTGFAYVATYLKCSVEILISVATVKTFKSTKQQNHCLSIKHRPPTNLCTCLCVSSVGTYFVLDPLTSIYPHPRTHLCPLAIFDLLSKRSTKYGVTGSVRVRVRC